MAETRDPSSPEMRAGSSGIPLHNDAIAPRERGAPGPSEAPLTGLTEGTEGIAARDRELRVFCRRLLGSSEARSVQVDDAVDGVIIAVARGLPIALRGTSDLVPVAYALHRRIVGVDRPFVVWDPRRREVEGSVRAPPNRRTVALALEAAMDGSICLRSRHLPADFDRLCESVRDAAPFLNRSPAIKKDDILFLVASRVSFADPSSCRCQELYTALTKRFAVDTHRNALVTAKSFDAWCVKQGWIATSPLADVAPIGQHNRGKNAAADQRGAQAARPASAKRTRTTRPRWTC